MGLLLRDRGAREPVHDILRVRQALEDGLGHLDLGRALALGVCAAGLLRAAGVLGPVCLAAVAPAVRAGLLPLALLLRVFQLAAVLLAARLPLLAQRVALSRLWRQDDAVARAPLVVAFIGLAQRVLCDILRVDVVRIVLGGAPFGQEKERGGGGDRSEQQRGAAAHARPPPSARHRRLRPDALLRVGIVLLPPRQHRRRGHGRRERRPTPTRDHCIQQTSPDACILHLSRGWACFGLSGQGTRWTWQKELSQSESCRFGRIPPQLPVSLIGHRVPSVDPYTFALNRMGAIGGSDRASARRAHRHGAPNTHHGVLPRVAVGGVARRGERAPPRARRAAQAGKGGPDGQAGGGGRLHHKHAHAQAARAAARQGRHREPARAGTGVHRQQAAEAARGRSRRRAGRRGDRHGDGEVEEREHVDAGRAAAVARGRRHPEGRGHLPPAKDQLDGAVPRAHRPRLPHLHLLPQIRPPRGARPPGIRARGAGRRVRGARDAAAAFGGRAAGGEGVRGADAQGEEQEQEGERGRGRVDAEHGGGRAGVRTLVGREGGRGFVDRVGRGT